MTNDNKQGWIACSESLPKFYDMFSERVLGYGGGTMKVVGLYKGPDGRIMGYNTTQHEYMMDVTHWMPLPTPPSGESN